MRHTLSALLVNQPGVLAKVTTLFSGRGFNIESLSVAETLDPSISRMTIVTRGNSQVIEQVTKQLNKLVDVIKVVDLFDTDYVDREMILIKVTAEPSSRAEILRIADIFRGKIVDVTPKSYTIEVTGDEGKIRAIITLLKPLGIKEVVRTGRVAISRGVKAFRPLNLNAKRM